MANKNICDVGILGSMSENTNVIVEENGSLNKLNLKNEIDSKINNAVNEVNNTINQIHAELNNNLNSKVPFTLDWIFIGGDFMAAIEPYCKNDSGYGKLVIFQTAGSATNTGQVPIYGLGMLITNGRDRHYIIAGNGSSWGQVTGFNNADIYSGDSWYWYTHTISNKNI